MTPLLLSVALSATLLIPPGGAFAQGMGPGMMGAANGSSAADDHTAREEAEGKAVWEKFQAKQVACANLSEADFAALGEYFMGLMMGDSHAAMNQMMVSAMGEEGEEQMHVAMGKRLSGCDPSAVYPASGSGFMPMMNMWGPYGMMGGRYSPNGWWGMHGYSGAWGWLQVLFSVFWWVFVVAFVVAAVKWIFGCRRGWHRRSSAHEILGERYAKGEISKQEFEEKKRDLTA